MSVFKRTHFLWMYECIYTRIFIFHMVVWESLLSYFRHFTIWSCNDRLVQLCRGINKEADIKKKTSSNTHNSNKKSNKIRREIKIYRIITNLSHFIKTLFFVSVLFSIVSVVHSFLFKNTFFFFFFYFIVSLISLTLLLCVYYVCFLFRRLSASLSYKKKTKHIH